MGNLSADVLIYLQSIKEYFAKNEETKKYFISDGDEEVFFEYLGKISQKLYEKKGDAQLSQEQFEILRRFVQIKAMAEQNDDKSIDDTDKHLYFNTKGFGRVYLN
jgi:hypothetical protein